MSTELQQENAALYALGLLDAAEAQAFEQELAADADLRTLTHELREAAALLVRADPGEGAPRPSASLRKKVVQEAKAEQSARRREIGAIRRPALTVWLPWALAALFMGCSGVLFWIARNQQATIGSVASHWSNDNALTRVSFCTLEPTPELAAVQPHAAVLWDAATRQGKLRVSRLAPSAAGKDYQLWVVESGRKSPVSAGLVRVDSDGNAAASFAPTDADGKPVVAVAISLEQAGGSPTNEGPILLLGKF